MIEIHINKDIGSYEPKLIGPLTSRQTICVAIGAPFAWLIYKAASPILTPDAATYLLAIPALFVFAFGWLKPYGMRLEKFIQSVFINMFLAPGNRKYMTENTHEKAFAALERYAKEQAEAEALALAQAEAETNSGKAKLKKSIKPKTKAQKKPRYVVSPEAVK